MARFFFVEIITEVLKERNLDVRFWLLGTSDERAIGSEICDSANTDRVSNLMGETNLPVTVELLKQSHLLITNDTGPMHIAAALEKPTAALFGPTDPTKTGPYGKIHKIFQTKVSCSPCFSRICPLEKQICLFDVISSKDVSEYIISNISRLAQSGSSLESE